MKVTAKGKAIEEIGQQEERDLEAELKDVQEKADIFRAADEYHVKAYDETRKELVLTIEERDKLKETITKLHEELMVKEQMIGRLNNHVDEISRQMSRLCTIMDDIKELADLAKRKGERI